MYSKKTLDSNILYHPHANVSNFHSLLPAWAGKKTKKSPNFFFLVYTFSPSPCCLHRTLVSFYALDFYLTIEGCFMFVISWFIQIDFCLQAIFTIKCFCMQQILLKIYLIQILQWIRAGLNTPVNLNTKIGFSYISHDWKLSFHFKCFEIHSKCVQFIFVRKRTSTKSIDIQCIIHPVRRRIHPVEEMQFLTPKFGAHLFDWNLHLTLVAVKLFCPNN